MNPCFLSCFVMNSGKNSTGKYHGNNVTLGGFNVQCAQKSLVGEHKGLCAIVTQITGPGIDCK